MIRKLYVTTILVLSFITVSGQGVWKGFNMKRTTDAFELEVPVGTSCLIVDEYESTQKFGKPTEDGDLLSSTTYLFDDKGYYIDDGKKEYENTYNSDGLIKEREIYKNGKLSERWIYKYMYDEKGPGTGIEKYNSDGDVIGAVAWQGNNYISQTPGGYVHYKLNKEGRLVSGTITVTNYRQEVNIHQSATYNKHGFPESTLMSAPGKSQEIYYSDYIYDDSGNWTQRYSNGKLTKRRILSAEEYAQLLEQQRIEEEEEAERERIRLENERKKKIAEETAQMVEKIKKQGYVEADSLESRPVIEVKLLETYETEPKHILLNIPATESSFITYLNKLEVSVKEPATFKFPNDSVGNVPSLYKGILSCKLVRNKLFTKPVELKLGLNKLTKEWEITNLNKIQKKCDISKEELDALQVRVRERGKEKPYTSKKLYFNGLVQTQVTLTPDEGSATPYHVSETFPIRFYISETKVNLYKELVKLIDSGN